MKILKNLLGYDIPLITKPDSKINGVEFIDLFPTIIDEHLYKDVTNIFTSKLTDKNIDYIISPESAKGFLYGGSVAYNLNCEFILVKKENGVISLSKDLNNKYENKNFYILDDIYATGKTINAIKKEIINNNGNIVGIGSFINIVDMNIYPEELFSIIDIEKNVI